MKKLYFSLLALAALVFLGTNTARAEGRLVVNLSSIHLEDKGYNYNETNTGLGLELPAGNFYLMGGFYNNSFGEISTYAGGGLEFFNTRHFSLCAEGGYLSGYPHTNIAAAVCARIKAGHHALKINYLPRSMLGEDKSDVLALQYVYQF